MSFKLETLTPMLETLNLDETIEFYENVLGFKRNAYDTEKGWVSLNRDDIEVMFTLPNLHRSTQKPIMSGSLYLRTDDVDAAWENLKGKAEVCYPIEDFDYGMREFAIFDNNGYLIQFGKELK